MVVLCFQGRLTVPIAVTAFVSALGSSFPHGWNTGVLNAPTQVSARRYRCLMGYCLFLSPRLSVKKIIFPVQRVAKIEASWAAAIFLIFPPWKYCPFLEKSFFFVKLKKRVSSRTFLSHPAGLTETELFLWTAPEQYQGAYQGLNRS